MFHCPSLKLLWNSIFYITDMTDKPSSWCSKKRWCFCCNICSWMGLRD